MDNNRLNSILSRLSGDSVKFKYAPPDNLKGTIAEKMLGYFAEIDQKIMDELTNYLATEPELEIFNRKMLNMGTGAGGVTYDILARWIILTAVNEGSDKAIELLEKYIALDHNPAFHILAISGLKLNKDFSFDDEIKLMPFENIPDSLQKHSISPLSTGGWFFLSYPAQIESSPQAAIVRKVQLFPKTFETSSRPRAPRGSNIIYDAFDVLSLVLKTSIRLMYAWYALESWIPCYYLTGSSWSGPNSDVIISQSCEPSCEDLNRLRKIYRLFSELSNEIKQQLRIPIRRLNQAKRRQSLEDMALDLGVALESLFLHDRSSHEQISFTFRLRGAWMLGEKPSDRAQIYDLLRAIYECRSKAIHSGKVPLKMTVNKVSKPTRDLLSEGMELCADVIMAIIQNRKFPEWDSLILNLK